jgi:hypothetical protein
MANRITVTVDGGRTIDVAIPDEWDVDFAQRQLGVLFRGATFAATSNRPSGGFSIDNQGLKFPDGRQVTNSDRLNFMDNPGLTAADWFSGNTDIGGVGPPNSLLGTGSEFDGTGNTGIGSTSLENEAGGRRAAFQDLLRSFGIESGVGGSAAGRSILNENVAPLQFVSKIQDAFGQAGPLTGEDRFSESLGRLGSRDDIAASQRHAFNTLRGGVSPMQFKTFDPIQKQLLEELLGSNATAPTQTGDRSAFAGTANNIIDLALRAGGINRKAARNFQFGSGGADLLAEFARSRPSNTGGLGEGGGSNFAQFVAERFDPGNKQGLFNQA